MKGRPGEGPEDVDAEFARIVEGLRLEGVGRDVPSQAEVKREAAESARQAEPEPVEPSGPPPTPWRGHETPIDWVDDNNDDEHYEPPEPPPLPRLRPATIVAIALLVAGVVLLVLPAVISLDARIATPVALLSLACGIGLMLLRARKTPHDHGDDGAQV